MQLRRDTEYALRILFHIGAECLSRQAQWDGPTLSEISSKAGVPKVIAGRICGVLEENEVIVSKKAPGGELLYRPGPAYERSSVLDIILLTEHNAKLFAVFDKNSSFYRAQGSRLQLIQAQLEKELSALKIKDFFAKNPEIV